MDRFLLFPLLAPALLLAAGNDAFGFDSPGWLDSFMYLGYFWHYPEHLWVFDDNSNYKISRLPWILPGYALHASVGPIVASYVLAYLTLTLGAVALYLLVRDSLDDRRSAALVGVAWACCTWAHGIGGWNYQVLVAAGYYLMACWLVVRAARGPSPRRAALLAGAFLAAAVHTHLFLAIFAPMIAVLHWAALREQVERTLSRVAVTAAFAIAGATALTAVLAAINGATGGAWLFFIPQIEQALKLTEPSYDHWWRGNAAEWLPTARYLVIPLALLAAGLAALFKRWGDPDRRMPLTLVALGWTSLAIMCFFQFVRRQTTLDYNYMAFALYPHAFAGLGVVFAASTRSTPRAWLATGLALLVVLATLLFLPSRLPDAMDALSASIGLGSADAILPPLVVSLLGVAVMSALRGSIRVAAFVAWFAIVNTWIAPAQAAYGLATPGYRQSMLRMFHDADRLTSDLDPSLIGIKYWMTDEVVMTKHGEVKLRAVFDSFLATRAWFTNLLARTSPSPPIEQLTIEDLDRGACIGVLSSLESQDRLRDAIAAHYAGLGRPLHEVVSRRFEGSGLSFALTVLRPSPVSEGARPCEKAEP